MQNNRFCNTLMIRLLCENFSCEKYLQYFSLFSMHKTQYLVKATLFVKGSFCSPRITLYCYFQMTYCCHYQ
ncbi:hypothetical protein CTM61_04755 [Prevotella intermedia]|nr:hypothetical protein CTM61_04755 [Prevotella intermedia]AWX07027.1 hypothetical protein CTM55_05010 [Prevotella intermedia]